MKWMQNRGHTGETGRLQSVQKAGCLRNTVVMQKTARTTCKRRTGSQRCKSLQQRCQRLQHQRTGLQGAGKGSSQRRMAAWFAGVAAAGWTESHSLFQEKTHRHCLHRPLQLSSSTMRRDREQAHGIACHRQQHSRTLRSHSNSSSSTSSIDNISPGTSRDIRQHFMQQFQ